jgi:hypothetical protein
VKVGRSPGPRPYYQLHQPYKRHSQTPDAIMSVAALSKSLPKPKYSGEEEELTNSARVLSAEQYETQVARKNGPPPYGSRRGWQPTGPEDFGDGGAFPEVPIAQYPLDMGKKGTSGTSNAMVRRVDGEGKTKYDEIARRGHGDSRIVQASFKDLIPLRQQANAGDLDLSRPSAEVVQETKEKTEQALMKLVAGQTAAQRHVCALYTHSSDGRSAGTDAYLQDPAETDRSARAPQVQTQKDSQRPAFSPAPSASLTSTKADSRGPRG